VEDQIFDDMLDTFSTDGWKLIIDDFRQLAEQAVNVQTIEDGNALQYRKGQLDILDRLLNYENTVRAQQSINELEDSDDQGV